MRFNKSVILGTVVLALFSNCLSDSYMLRLSMGHTGCNESEMQLSEKDMSWGPTNVSSWKVVCKGNTYYCSSTGQVANCKQAAK